MAAERHQVEIPVVEEAQDDQPTYIRWSWFTRIVIIIGAVASVTLLLVAIVAPSRTRSATETRAVRWSQDDWDRVVSQIEKEVGADRPPDSYIPPTSDELRRGRLAENKKNSQLEQEVAITENLTGGCAFKSTGGKVPMLTDGQLSPSYPMRAGGSVVIDIVQPVAIAVIRVNGYVENPQGLTVYVNGKEQGKLSPICGWDELQLSLPDKVVMVELRASSKGEISEVLLR
ncbi:MAG: hypothetical protein CEN89_282 [Candidatus Berkelbacteria bacterium Licking1014_7]|uniref:Uncharacterized protein n=1 Tax=Candidatus Berkelbacteria bacterium Licking1014_7 TaxID=2017147 RepID=A0A554LJK2_9BACT|nr:MAG: hypothetical protein CEN89_282 [Candidatus Berkelbacteria bacterium Licking1014_7]